MKKLTMLTLGACMVLALASCKSSESAYKKAYEQARQRELAEPQVTVPEEVTPVVSAPVPVASVAPVREEKVTVVSGNDNLKSFSVVCGSFSLKANAEGLKSYLEGEGYTPVVAYNSDKNTYRVIVNTFEDRAAAAKARDDFKAKYPAREDFQGSWLLYRIY